MLYKVCYNDQNMWFPALRTHLKNFLDVLRFTVAEYGPVSSHGGPVHAIVCVFVCMFTLVDVVLQT